MASQLTMLVDFFPAGFFTIAVAAFSAFIPFAVSVVLAPSPALCHWLQSSLRPQFPQRSAPGYTAERQFGHQAALAAFAAG